LDNYPANVFQYQSKRGFLTITGKYHGVPISIIAVGMGFPMMDFMLREVREVVDGEMVVIRFGTCGCIGNGTVGQVAVADSSMAVLRNYDFFVDGTGYPYTLTHVIPADADMCASLTTNLIKGLGHQTVVKGLNVSADSFYSSQARSDGNYLDANDNLILGIKNAHPEALTFEMETYMLFHLASCSVKNASSASNVLAGPKRVVQAGELPAASSLQGFQGADVGATAVDESVDILKRRGAGEKIKTSVRGASCQMIVGTPGHSRRLMSKRIAIAMHSFRQRCWINWKAHAALFCLIHWHP